MKEFDVFISHASEDKYLARLLRGYFRAHNIHSWLDQDQFNPSMPRDDNTLRERILPAIRNSRYFIVLISDLSLGKEWVRAECEAARQMREEGEEIELAVILLDDDVEQRLPEWVQGLARFHLRRADNDVDPLETLRDEIGEKKPTYISKVAPNFLKQIPQREVDETLEHGMGDVLSMYFVDGGNSLQNVVFPAVDKLMRSGAREKLRCELLLMNSKLLWSPSWFSFDGPFQRRLDVMINASEVRARSGAQDQFVREAAELFAEKAARHAGLEYEIRLTDRLPVGRFIFTGQIGLFAPAIGRPHNGSPVFLFNSKSPFYEDARENFNEVYAAAQVYTPS